MRGMLLYKSKIHKNEKEKSMGKFEGENKKDRGKSKRTGGILVRNLLTIAVCMLLGMGILLACGRDVTAADDRPVGGLAERSELPELGVDEVESGVEVFEDELAPQPLNTILDTGEHYKYLSEKCKVLYQGLYKAITEHKYVPYKFEEFYLGRGYTSDERFKTYAYVYNVSSFAYTYSIRELTETQEALAYDHPDRVEFYLCGSYFYPAYYVQNGKAHNWIMLKAYYDENKFDKMDSDITASLNRLVKSYKSKKYVDEKFDAVTEWKVYDAYSPSIKYDTAAAKKTGDEGYFHIAHTAYGALCKKLAVCDGYSCGFQLLMESFGIESRIVTGMANGAGGWGGHAWNMVKLDGKWYDTDTTWYGKEHNYFNKTTDAISSNHRRTAGTGYLGCYLEKATGTYWTYDYLKKESKKKTWSHDKTTAVNSISISPASVELSTDQSVSLSVSFNPSNASNKKYTLTSSNPKVAYVSGDAVTGVAPGTAVITATSEDGNRTARCNVTVGLPVTGISVSPTSKTISVNESFDLSVGITPLNAINRRCALISSNSSVARVSGKTVTGVGPGTTTITAYSEEGAFMATCTVTVVYVPVTGISVTPNVSTLNVGESVALAVDIAPSNASDKNYTITSDSPEVVSINGNILTGIGPGTAEITVASNDGKITAKSTIIVNVAKGLALESAAGFTYSVIGGSEVAIVKAPENTSAINIPGIVVWGNTRYKVSKISDNAFKNNKTVTTVSGGSNIKSIGKSAFQGCTKLKKVTIKSKKLKSIGSKAFYNCKRLGKLTICGNKLKTVKSNAFKNVKKGIKITIVAKSDKYLAALRKIRKAVA